MLGLWALGVYPVFVPSRHRRLGEKFVISYLSIIICHLSFEKVMENSTRAVVSARKQNATNDFNEKTR